MHLVFSGTAQSQPSQSIERGGRLGRRDGVAVVSQTLSVRSRIFVAALAASVISGLPAVAAGSGYPAHTPISEVTQPPIGWMEFCVEYYPECKTKPSVPRDILLTTQAWKQLKRINLWVNTHVKPMTDMDHWGVVERWNYPDDGYGDCEDYVLLKRRLLIQLGWPRESLLVTVVLANEDEGHAVLTVTTDKGDYVLDNKREDMLPWSETGYRFVKRQSQSDPNLWVSLIDPKSVTATATGFSGILRPRTHN
jgi:predicted transglutaminase-like cysteine proteinase